MPNVRAIDNIRSDFEKIPLSTKIIGTVIEAWKIGRTALALLVIGTILILSAFAIALRDQDKAFMALAFLALGSLLIGFVTYMFYLEAVVPMRRAAKLMKQNAELINSIQDASLELTQIVAKFNDFALIHANDIVSNIDTIKNFARFIPGGDRIINAEYLTRSDSFARKIRSVTESSQNIISEFHNSVKQSDASRIIKHVQDLQSIKKHIESEFFPAERVPTQN